MLGLFRKIQVSTLLWLFLYALVLRLPAILGWVDAPEPWPVEISGPLYDLLPAGWQSPGWGSGLAALILVLIQAFALNFMVDRYRLMDQRNWFPGMMHVLLASSAPDMLWLSPPFLAATVLPLLAGELFSLYKKPVVTAAVFNAGFWLGLGVLFYPPVLFLFPAVLLIIRSLRSFSLQEHVVLLTGLFVPLFLFWAGAFYFDAGGAVWMAVKKGLSASPGIPVPDTPGVWVQYAFWGLLILIILLSSPMYFHKKLIQVQKYVSGLFWMFLFGVVAILFLDQANGPEAWLLVPVAAVLAGMTLHGLRNKALAEVVHLALLGGVFFMQYSTYLN